MNRVPHLHRPVGQRSRCVAFLCRLADLCGNSLLRAFLRATRLDRPEYCLGHGDSSRSGHRWAGGAPLAVSRSLGALVHHARHDRGHSRHSLGSGVRVGCLRAEARRRAVTSTASCVAGSLDSNRTKETARFGAVSTLFRQPFVRPILPAISGQPQRLCELHR